MKNFWILFSCEWRLFRSEKGLVFLAALILLAGVYGIYYGASEINQQRAHLAGLQNLKNQNIAELKIKFPDAADAGEIAYYHPVFAVHHPSAWAGISLGQRDLMPYYLKLRLLGLQAQLYDTENINPQKALTGNFDLAFVLVYLFPLLIIALGYNILSSEKERGTLPLLLSQPVTLPMVVLAKLAFRGVLILTLFLSLGIIAVWWHRLPVDERLIYFAVTGVFYLLFWLAITFLVVSWQRNSAVNAVSLLGIWLVLTIVVPGLLTIYVAAAKPVPQGLDLTIQQREVVHSGWDKPKKETLNKFFVHYPQYTDTTTIRERFVWRWYYAMHEVGDQSVSELAQAYRKGLQERYRLAEQFSFISAPLNTHLLLNSLAATDLPAYLDFLNSAENYHQQLKEFYYPFLFKNQPFTHQDYSRVPGHYFSGSPDTRPVQKGLLTLGASIVAVIVTALVCFKITGLNVK